MSVTEELHTEIARLQRNIQALGDALFAVRKYYKGEFISGQVAYSDMLLSIDSAINYCIQKHEDKGVKE